ncbi:MAG TPA: DUF222 domain-containing protein [Galbitalea sp.]|nr:DUF222 domain-containing protein [Galbitalea sp.]
MIAGPGTQELDATLESLSSFALPALSLADDRELTRVAVLAEQIARRLSAVQVAAAAEVADRSRRELGTVGLAAQHGHVRPAAFLEEVLRISGAEASRRITLGGALRRNIAMTGDLLEPRFPVVAAAVASGEVGPESAAVIVRALDDARRVAAPDDLDIAETGLVEYARGNRVQDVSALAIVVRDRLDPDGILPREEETQLRRGIVLGRERNGVVPIRGAVEPVAAALLRSTFDEANAPGAKPRFLSEEDRNRGTVTTVNDDGGESVTVTDVRTREQRQHDVLAGLLKAGIRNTGREAGQIRSTAEIMVHVSLADIEAGTGAGWIEGIHEPISMSTAERILCDAAFRKVVLGNEGEPLALGKAQYPFTSAQRKAIVARDGDTCLMCDAPAAWTDAHHVHEFFTHGAVGRTDVDDGVLLCEPHHDLFHKSEWKLSMIGGIPHVLAPLEVDPSQRWKRAARPRLSLSSTA